MIVYIDESGTHLGAKNATLSVVYLEVKKHADFENKVLLIEKKLGISHFHWNKQDWRNREKFMDELMNLNFTFGVAIYGHPEKFASKFPDMLAHLVTQTEIAKMVIDGYKPKWYLNALKKMLRDRGTSVKKLVSARKDESYPGLRVADCLAGLIRYHYDHSKSNAERWVKKLKKEKKLIFELLVT
ncbi:DUF3800 domain-containing protein [Candidatus Amesbacteria bacterium]|nr:DUF3800 domain-containing protein [Candidatus Amesbacteria bacterium]